VNALAARRESISMEALRLHNRALVIGVGNEFRNDDGVGLMVGCRLKELNLEGVEVLCLTGEGADLLRTWRNHDTVFLVDAVVSRSSVGTVHRIDLQKQTVPSEFSGPSSHALGIAESVELARVLGTLPSQCVFFGIEVENVGMGTKVSRRVAEAADAVAGLILREIQDVSAHLTSVA
jgi:hydrogenase maturation protease